MSRQDEADADRRFAELIERHSRVIGAAIRRVCGKRHSSLVPDIEQELRLALWKRLRRGGEIEHPVAYVHRAALTTALTFLRRQASERQTSAEGAVLEASVPLDPPRDLFPVEERRLLEQLLGDLPGDQAWALRAYLAGFNHVETARLYGWTESTARHRIYRGMERLRKTFGEGKTDD